MGRTVLITGANRGIGLEAAVQFAQLTGTDGISTYDKVIITARDKRKGEAAIADASKRSGRPTSVFACVELDLVSHASVWKAVESLPSSLDTVVLNAGGLMGESLTKHDVTESFGANVLGHSILVEGLIKAGKIASEGARVVFSHSETTRSVWPFAGMQPFVRLYKNEMAGSLIAPPKRGVFGIAVRQRMNTYANSKLIGGLYFSALAREQPQIYFVSISPGGCGETDVYADAPQPMAFLMSLTIVKWIASRLGVVHSASAAAARYIRAATDAGFPSKFQSGAVVGGPYFRIADASGELRNQADFSTYYDDRELQDEALRIVRDAAARG